MCVVFILFNPDLDVKACITELYKIPFFIGNVELLVFSVAPFKKDQNQKRSTEKVQNLGNERRKICKDHRQDFSRADWSRAVVTDHGLTWWWRN